MSDYKIFSAKFRAPVERHCEFMTEKVKIEAVDNPEEIKKALRQQNGWKLPVEPFDDNKIQSWKSKIKNGCSRERC
jgi:hypothetical protein